MSIVEVELKGSEGGSDPIATMSKQAGSRSRKSSCGGSSSRASTMSSAAKLQMNVRLAEPRLKHVQEELRLKTQQAVLQAKAAVTEARIKTEAMQESEGSLRFYMRLVQLFFHKIRLVSFWSLFKIMIELGLQFSLT